MTNYGQDQPRSLAVRSKQIEALNLAGLRIGKTFSCYLLAGAEAIFHRADHMNQNLWWITSPVVSGYSLKVVIVPGRIGKSDHAVRFRDFNGSC